MINKRELSEREIWFRNHIGKRVFRNDNGCLCSACKNVLENGLIINDQFHADYLYDCEAEYAGESIPVKYFDNKEEAIAFDIQTGAVR